MSKLRLDLDTLAVESFDTDSAGTQGRGTVRGHVAPTAQFGCYNDSRFGGPCALSDDDPTCLISCGYEQTRCPYGGTCVVVGTTLD
ncbi:MAG TPA: hypothetical protein VEX86_02930 [Longimicrobium sp.]|nr:hypothetical protein [Longimicrobium sp.]